jgi:hypothetical protein
MPARSVGALKKQRASYIDDQLKKFGDRRRCRTRTDRRHRARAVSTHRGSSLGERNHIGPHGEQRGGRGSSSRQQPFSPSDIAHGRGFTGGTLAELAVRASGASGVAQRACALTPRRSFTTPIGTPSRSITLTVMP